MEKKEALSIKDIARVAKVSHSTVSRALRNSHLVNSATADRIRRIAAESNFRLSAVGRSLATGRTYSIGVIAASIADPFTGEVVSAIDEAVEARGYSVILSTSRSDPERELRVVQTFEERRVDGLLVIGSRVEASYSALLEEMKVPVVMINSQHAAYSVTMDMVAASRAAVRFLGQLGHRRIAYVGDRLGFQSNIARHEGYALGLQAVNLPYSPEMVVNDRTDPQGWTEAMDYLLSLPAPPTAVFCYNDMTALAVLASAWRHNVSVPERVSVVGFDDLLVASYTHPALTTVRQPKHLMGQLAAEILLNLIAGSTTELSRRLQGELIVRESTAPPPFTR